VAFGSLPLLAVEKSPRIGGGGQSSIFLSWEARDERRKARDN